MNVRHYRLSLAVLVAALFVGCQEQGVRRVPASGVVTVDGHPFEGSALISFAPDASKGNSARVDCSTWVGKGQFNLASQGMLDRDTGPGAPVGWFKVFIREFKPGNIKLNEDGSPAYSTDGKPVKDASVKPQVIARKYFDEKTTTVSIELTDPPPPEGYRINFTRE